MADQPDVHPGDWITIGNPSDYLVSGQPEAVVCSFPIAYPLWVEVVYLEAMRSTPPHKKQRTPIALQSYVVWGGKRWQWARDYPNEGYADNYSRLTEFVRILRKGRPRPE